MQEALTTTGVKHEARRVARSRWIGHLGRFGLVAQAFCFALIAVLALALALGMGGRTTDPQGAFAELARHGWTEVLLVLVAAGFASYAAWRFAQAVFDRGGQGSDASGLARRTIQFFQFVTYTALAVGAVRVLLGDRTNGERAARQTAAGILSWPGGTIIVGLIGGTFGIVAIVNVYWGLSGRFMESLEQERLAERDERFLSVLGRVGFTSLGIVYGIIGWFLIKAALDFDAGAVVGLGGALATLANATYGKWLLGLTASGLLVYGLFGFAQVRYHRV
jgi:uncharacterized protein DUF1206